MLTLLPLFLFKCLQKDKDATRELRHSIVVDTAALASKANLLYDLKSYSDALPIYDSLLKIDSTNGKYIYRKASCLFRTDRHRDAISAYNRSATLGYRVSDAYFSIALCYTIIDASEEGDSLCILYMKKTLEVNPNDKEAKRLLEGFQRYGKKDVLL